MGLKDEGDAARDLRKEMEPVMKTRSKNGKSRPATGQLLPQGE
jgi:hypothetical protein